MTQSRWETLSEELSCHIAGHQITHAVFTTYSFDLEFFEASIFPLLLPEQAQSLSMNSALRRLQLEKLLRERPIPTDVYFDAGVAVPGSPWLPYSLHPVSIQQEFHGKVVLLRLREEGSDRIRWLLGAGSANLTRAGWWENIEVWHFAPLFDLQRVPAGLALGLQTLLNYLAKQQVQFDGHSVRESATRMLLRELNTATVGQRRKKGEAEFAVFIPEQGQRFPSWIQERTPAHSRTHAEVLSPYFGTEGHGALVEQLRNSLKVDTIRMWLPYRRSQGRSRVKPGLQGLLPVA